jgi:hypothetical protein
MRGDCLARSEVYPSWFALVLFPQDSVSIC